MAMEMHTREILITLGVACALLIIFVVHLEIRVRRLTRGGKAKNLDEAMSTMESDIKIIKQFKVEMIDHLANVEIRLGRSVQGVGTVRFNPFRGNGEGGSQSFASSFISEKGNGVVLSSLYSRDHVSIFSKPIKDFKSEYELTDEEKKSLVIAREIFSKK
ncbi:MAG: DUF4446 family protein [Candidatus Taylorbacteria bacterium]|nr:DUF4446 family protein [Candidatus Taylorbacteria bacterium]